MRGTASNGKEREPAGGTLPPFTVCLAGSPPIAQAGTKRQS